MVPVERYLVIKHERQRQLLRAHNVRTLYDLFQSVQCDTDRVPFMRDALVVLKGRLISWLNVTCHNLYMDFPKLKRDPLVRMGGQYPFQYVAILHQRVPSMVQQFSGLNMGMSDEAALERAILVSTRLMHQDAARKKRRDAPEDICCPITLDVFVDPVTTIHGTVYERSAILDWFAKQDERALEKKVKPAYTDPMTNEALPTNAVWSHKETREKIRAYMV